jgi:hypothetical protein
MENEVPLTSQSEQTQPTKLRERSALEVMQSEDQPGYLFFHFTGASQVSADQQELVLALDKTAAVLRARFQSRDSERFAQHFKTLFGIAESAFPLKEQDAPSLEIGMVSQSLEEFKTEIVHEEGSIAIHEHLRKVYIAVIKAMISIAVIAIMAQAFIYYAKNRQAPWIIHNVSQEQQNRLVLLDSISWDDKFSVLHFGVLLIGTMLGVWASLSIKSASITFEQLATLEEDLIKPWIRLTTIGLLALILALFFHYRVVTVSIGDTFSTSHIHDNAIIAFLIGLCLGFSDKVLPTEVQKRVGEFVSRAQTTGNHR